MSPFASIFPDLEEAALRQGLRDLLSGKIDRFTHAYVADTRQGPRSQRWEISLVSIGAAMCFAAVPEGLADAAEATTTLGLALHEAVANRARIERHYAVAAGGDEPRPVRVTPIRLGRRTHLLAFPGDLEEPADSPAAERMLFAQEEERHRIAIELHDSTSQHLVAVSLGLARLRRFVRATRAERQVLEDMSQSLQDAIKEIRTFSYLMNPPQLERDGLETTVRRFVAGFEARTGLPTSLGVAGAPDVSSTAVQHTVFRVLQEALTNIYRHAQATRIAVTLVRRAGWITLAIGDDAPAAAGGVDQPGRAPVGVGIAGMHAPVAQLGGSLRVLHGAGGDQIVARLPTGVGLRPRSPGQRRVRPRAH
ncbi:MAG TPA: sensor histidine kinase [Caulobacteraceae bacterium]|nr:sensor histidine kinase [Caulobacteraceae bacterium]